MPFLGLDYAPASPIERLVQQDRIALASAAAASVPPKGFLRGLGSFFDELSGLGAPPKQNPVAYNPKYAAHLAQMIAKQQARAAAVATRMQTPLPGPTPQQACQTNGGYWDGQRCIFQPKAPVPQVPIDLPIQGSSMSGLAGLGAAPPRQGTRAWWIWYATIYLPQYYSQQQIYQYVQQSPYYQYFGSPFSYPIPYQYGYGYQQPQINYGYGYSGSPSYNQYGYLYDPYSQAQYTQYVGEQGASACAAGGGYYDYAQGTCNYVNSYPYGGSSYGTVQSYGPGSSPPNVVGMPYAQAVALLNQTGFNVWLLNLNGVSQGIPPGYSQNRVSISVKNGVVDSAAVG